MTFNEFKELVIEQCAARGIAEYELYYENSSSTSVDTFQHSINGFSSSTSGGLCFRCIVDGRMGYASTEALSPEQAVAVVAKAVDNAENLETEEAVFLGEGGQSYEPLPQRGYAAPTTEEMIDMALATTEKIYAADAMAVDGCQSEIIRGAQEVDIYNSRGLDLHRATSYAGVVAVGVVSDGQAMSNDYQIKLGCLSEIDTDAMAKKAIETAKIKLGGEPAPTGQYPVIFNPDAMCSLLQVYSSIFNSEAARKGLSQLAGKEGQVIAAPIVTLVDDPFHPENPEPANFDAEGSPTHKKCIIENGVLNTLLYNLKTAAAAGKKTTGNASKGGYNSSVGIQPFTLYLAGGEYSEAQLLQMAGNGVYITDLSGLHAGADAVSGDFSLQSEGYMIENGEKTRFVKSFTVAGNFYELLKNITALADNCHLPHAMGMTAFGSPSVLVQGLSIAGK